MVDTTTRVVSQMLDALTTRTLGSPSLDERFPTVGALRYDDYYRGRHPMAWVHSKASVKYRRLIRQAVSNFPVLVVDSVADRLQVQGFRLDEQEADRQVWDNIWQANSLDVYSPMVHQQALVTGISYVSVWPDETTGSAKVRGESSFEVYHDPYADDPLRVQRVFKVWADVIGGKWYGRLYTAGTVVYLSADYKAGQNVPTKWDVDQRVTDAWYEDDLPIVPVLNRPRLDGTGISELDSLLPVFDRINTLTAQMLMAAELAAFKIRWATGIDIPTDATGKRVEPFDVALDRLWTSENPDARFGSFDATPLTPYSESIDQAISQVAAISRTPPSMLTGKITNLSAEALKSMESGLVNKVKHRMRTYGEAWEQVIRLALRVENDPRAALTNIETIWVDPENISEAARVDALTKLANLGLPFRAVMEKWGASPQEVDRWDQMRMEDAFSRLMQTSSAQPPGFGQGQGQPGQQMPEMSPTEVAP